MRQNHVISLLQSGYTTIQCVYDLSADAKPSGVLRAYTFKTTLELKEDDLVVVPHSTGGMKVVKVVAVHAEPKIDLNANFDYAWTICKVDTSEYERIQKAEALASEELNKAEQKKLRAQALEGLQALYGEDIKSLEMNLKEK